MTCHSIIPLEQCSLKEMIRWCERVIDQSCASQTDHMRMFIWCERVVDQGRSSHTNHLGEFYWSCQTTKYIDGCQECAFEFANAQHKLLFDIAWGHLSIYSSAAQLKAATGY